MFSEQSLIAMLLLPVAGAVLSVVLARPRDVLAAIVVIALIELVLALDLWAGVLAGKGYVTGAEEWLYVDAFSAFHIVVLALVFALSSAFAAIYFTGEAAADGFGRATARRFGALWLGAEATMLLVLTSHNLGVMWVGMEATTLLTAFLISLHATQLPWKRCGNT